MFYSSIGCLGNEKIQTNVLRIRDEILFLFIDFNCKMHVEINIHCHYPMIYYVHKKMNDDFRSLIETKKTIKVKNEKFELEIVSIFFILLCFHRVQEDFEGRTTTVHSKHKEMI